MLPIFNVDNYTENLIIKKINLKQAKKVTIRKGKYSETYVKACAGFDIETTTIVTEEYKHAYMYHWQMAINGCVLFGRNWNSFKTTLCAIKRSLEEYTTRHGKHKTDNKKIPKIIIWVANLSFEFQFMRKRVNVTKIFAKRKREPLLVEIDNCIEFRDCLAITGGSLAFLAKNYTTTQKLKGDLDYSILRNSKTILTDKETDYCYNDVVILHEFAEYIFLRYLENEKYIPMTKTGILRQDIKKGVNESIKQKIQQCLPNEQLYNIMMKWLFRGGVSHGNVSHIGVKLSNVKGFDYTSSYPAVMNHNLFPCSQFVEMLEISIEIVEQKIKNGFAVMFACEFENIKATTMHSIESESKCISLQNYIIDNGRVFSAEKMGVFLTDVDYKNYKKFYKWDNIKVIRAWYAVYGRLPQYFLQPLNAEYRGKAELKKNGKDKTKEYAEKKGKVNSAYGMTVTKLYNQEIKYINDEWIEEETKKDYNQLTKNLFLLPQWGVWITAWARYNLLQTIYKIGNDVVQYDTDSIYILNWKKHKPIIDEWNKEIHKQNIELFGNDENFDDLGEWDEMPCYRHFKTLGAKRYMAEKDGKILVTIAGLPKGALQEYCKNNNKDIWETFTNEMYLDVEFAMKNAHTYNDEYHYDVVNGEEMEEYSSVAIYATTFKLNMNDLFIKLIDYVEELKK